MIEPAAEFQLIARHFRPLTGAAARALQDDAAVLRPPAGRDLVIAADAMVENVHFLPDQPPDLLARKLLRVNLSDLAAMGAMPLGYLLTIAVPRITPDAWFAAFAAGLAEDQRAFGLTLLGGDTTSTEGPKSLSLTILGHVAPGMAVGRCGARAGDGIWVTGTIGDGALGLAAARGEIPDPDGSLLQRYRLPTPRLNLAIGGIASAAIDVSDGLVQDIGHLAQASGVAAEIGIELVPMSLTARNAGAAWQKICLGGGDDYELALAVPPSQEAMLLERARSSGVPVTRIGRFLEGDATVVVKDAGQKPVSLDRTGWSHF